MATAVERPTSALNDMSLIARRQRRPSIVEVIDVDLLDDPPHTAGSRPLQSSSRHGQRRESAIELIDSDEEPASSLPEASGSSMPQGPRQRLFSPPPQLQPPHGIPPVPRIPQRYSSLTSFPMRRHPPPHHSPPVVPIAQPFAFEAAIAASSNPSAGPSRIRNHPNRNRRIPSPAPAAAAASHHIPSLGLGGALIAFNQAQSEQRTEQSIRDRPGFINRAGTLMRRVIRSAVPGMGFRDDSDLEDDVPLDDDIPAFQLMLAQNFGLESDATVQEERFGHPARGYAFQEMLFQRAQDRKRSKEIEYQAEYTHPGKPESGFTFDFAPPSPTAELSPKTVPKPQPIVIDLDEIEGDGPVAGSSSQIEPPAPSLHTLLVCARCLDPLILGGGLVGEEGGRKKVWALRCGHMIDGKCLDIVGVPSVDIEPRHDAKGKGKAKTAEELNIPLAPENSMRSRLRSRTQSHPPSMSPPQPSGSSSSSSATGAQPQPSVQSNKRKRQAVSATRIEATHEWTCPVDGCGKVHASVKMGGVWVPEPPASTNEKSKGKKRARWGLGGPAPEPTHIKPGRGAIGLFV